MTIKLSGGLAREVSNSHPSPAHDYIPWWKASDVLPLLDTPWRDELDEREVETMRGLNSGHED